MATIVGEVNTAFGLIRRSGLDFKRLFALLVISVVTATVFSPGLSAVTGFDMKAGEIAFEDIVSPVNVSAEVVGADAGVSKGELIIKAGEPATAPHIAKFAVIRSELSAKRLRISAFGIFFFTLMLTTITYIFATANTKKASAVRHKDLLLVAILFISGVLATAFIAIASRGLESVFPAVPDSFYIFMVPLALGPILVTLFLRSDIAFVYAAVASIVAGLILGGRLDATAYFFIGSVAAAMGVRYCSQRATVIKAGLVLGVVNALALLSLTAMNSGGEVAISALILLVISGLLNGVITAILAVGLGPVIESLFKYTTSIKLLELSRLDHPLLKLLAEEAPGTYHHSISIGSLVESAAVAIDADPLLARVAAYYHDVGKASKPRYFVENNRDVNKHDTLQPSMSALIISNHVKEGVEMAASHGLGREITDIIQEHHGTSLIKFFYEKAKAQEAENGGAEVKESDFRYPGPKPQTREAGLVMLADALEAASKTIPDPTPDKIQGMTQTVVNRFFTDGQLDECELTLKDLHLISQSFNKVFEGIFHQRIDYPEPAYITRKKDSDDEGSDRGEGPEGGDGSLEGGEGEGKADSREALKRLGVR